MSIDTTAITRRNQTSQRVQRPTLMLLVVGLDRRERRAAVRVVVAAAFAHVRRPVRLPGEAAKWRATQVVGDTAPSVGRLPARRVVLVDDHRAHALVHVVTIDDPRHDAKLGAHAGLERMAAPVAHLRERELQTGRRFGADGLPRSCRPFRLVGDRLRLALRAPPGSPRHCRRENVRSMVAPPRHRSAPGPTRSVKCGQHRVDRHRCRTAPRASRRSDATAHDALQHRTATASAAFSRSPVSAQIGADLARQAAAAH